MSEATDKLVDLAVKTTEDLVTFIQDQAPDLGADIITWGLSMGVLGFVLCLLFGFLIYKSIRYLFTSKSSDGLDVICTVVAVVLCLFIVPIFIELVVPGIQALVAPKLYLFNYLKGFI